MRKKFLEYQWMTGTIAILKVWKGHRQDAIFHNCCRRYPPDHDSGSHRIELILKFYCSVCRLKSWFQIPLLMQTGNESSTKGKVTYFALFREWTKRKGSQEQMRIARDSGHRVSVMKSVTQMRYLLLKFFRYFLLFQGKNRRPEYLQVSVSLWSFWHKRYARWACLVPGVLNILKPSGFLLQCPEIYHSQHWKGWQ